MSNINQLQQFGFQGEILNGAEPPGRKGALEVNVRWKNGTLKYGPAQLVYSSGLKKSVTVLWMTHVQPDRRMPRDPLIITFGITGASLSDIVPGTILIQE